MYINVYNMTFPVTLGGAMTESQNLHVDVIRDQDPY